MKFASSEKVETERFASNLCAWWKYN